MSNCALSLCVAGILLTGCVANSDVSANGRPLKLVGPSAICITTAIT